MVNRGKPVAVTVLCGCAALLVCGGPTATAQLLQGVEGEYRRKFGPQEMGIGINNGRFSLWQVLQFGTVRAELELTKAQAEAIDRLAAQEKADIERTNEQYARAKEALGENPDPAAVKALSAARRDASLERDRKRDLALRNVLDRGRYTRLEQIWIQSMGPVAFTLPQIQDRLNLDPDQVSQIRDIARQGVRSLYTAAAMPTGLMPGSQTYSANDLSALRKSKKYQESLQDARKEAFKSRVTTMQTIAKVLTKGQRERYRKMVGEPFNFLASGDGGPAKDGQNGPQEKPGR